MDKKKNNSRKNNNTNKIIAKEEYGYSFVPELDMWLNIDLQKENADKFSKLTNDDIIDNQNKQK